jgi:hypothetical protein
VKLVRITRAAGDGGDDVVLTVGPLDDAEADDYASRLGRLVEESPARGLSVDTTEVESASGETADAPVAPAELLRSVLARGEGDGGRDLPGPDPRG